MVDELQEIGERFLRADEDAAAIELADFIMLDGDLASRVVVVAYRQSISHFVCNQATLLHVKTQRIMQLIAKTFRNEDTTGHGQ